MSYKPLILILLITSVYGCANHSKAPVRSLAQDKSGPAEIAHSIYRVRAGDTLYSIAFRYGLNYQGLARKNDIQSPYRILVGQTLILDDQVPAYYEVIQPEVRTTQPPVKEKQKSTPKKSVVASKPQQKKPVGRTTKPATKSGSTQTSSPSSYDTNRKVSGWRWPLDAQKTFQKRTGQQLFFDVSRGTNVNAVADGRVVYSGKGLVGYGHLVIIKHNRDLLSAYAFNDKVFVQERQNVKAGDRLATVGSSPTGEVGLGFEIRYQGRPVSPLRYLPKP